MGSTQKLFREEFLVDFISFLKDYNFATSEAIRRLAKIQETYPDEYESFKEFEENPVILNELIEKIPDEIGSIVFRILITIFMKLETLSRRLKNLYSLNVEEQRKLADDLDKSGNEIEEDIKRLKVKLEEVTRQ